MIWISTISLRVVSETMLHILESLRFLDKPKRKSIMNENCMLLSGTVGPC